jgi:hypothetical protein
VLADRRSWLPQPFVPPFVRDVISIAVSPADAEIPEDTVWAETATATVDNIAAEDVVEVEAVVAQMGEVEATAEDVVEAEAIAAEAPELSVGDNTHAERASVEEMVRDDTLPSISDFLVAGAFPEASANAPQWPIADVGAEVTRLSEGVPVAPRDGREADLDGAEGTPVQGTSETHAAWSDDEAWLDIMPAASPAVERELEAQTAWARAFGEPPAPLPSTPATGGNVFTAARALEEVARRLRAGELSLPAWSPDGGEAAALAATLTALLGARR